MTQVNFFFFRRAHGSKLVLPQLTVLDDEVKTDEVKNSLQELSFDDAERTEHIKRRGNTWTDSVIVFHTRCMKLINRFNRHKTRILSLK